MIDHVTVVLVDHHTTVELENIELDQRAVDREPQTRKHVVLVEPPAQLDNFLVVHVQELVPVTDHATPVLADHHMTVEREIIVPDQLVMEVEAQTHKPAVLVERHVRQDMY
mmetsp:Transcript_38577/g.83075  ORF Transcript_38577/g.83075 Transcript_38577/m.83075 type:complete len:111 (-) Transcript_38577:149-481(-)